MINSTQAAIREAERASILAHQADILLTVANSEDIPQVCPAIIAPFISDPITGVIGVKVGTIEEKQVTLWSQEVRSANLARVESHLNKAEWAKKIATRIGLVAILVLLATIFVTSNIVTGIGLGLLGVCVLSACVNAYQQARLQKLFQEFGLQAVVKAQESVLQCPNEKEAEAWIVSKNSKFHSETMLQRALGDPKNSLYAIYLARVYKDKIFESNPVSPETI